MRAYQDERWAVKKFVILAITMTAGAFPPGQLYGEATVRSGVEQLNLLAYAEDLNKEDVSDREYAAHAIRSARTELIKRLLGIVEAAGQSQRKPSMQEPVEHPWHESKHLAIFLLGDLRASDAIPRLLENINYLNPRTIYVSEPLDIGGWYPAAEALSKIGMPAVDPIVAALSQLDPKSKTADTCCWILREILGVKLARARIQIAIEETRDASVRERLQAAFPYFRTPQEKAAEERAAQNEAAR